MRCPVALQQCTDVIPSLSRDHLLIFFGMPVPMPDRKSNPDKPTLEAARDIQGSLGAFRAITKAPPEPLPVFRARETSG